MQCRFEAEQGVFLLLFLYLLPLRDKKRRHEYRIFFFFGRGCFRRGIVRGCATEWLSAREKRMM